METTNLVAAIEGAVPQLLQLARSLTWNNISDNCIFIISEITDEPTNAYQRQRLTKRLNDAKRPLSLAALAPALHQLHGNLHDINLYVYRAAPEVTVVDIRYYPRSSLSPAYREQVATRPPMLHVKVTPPPWVAWAQPPPKFDINWEHQVIWTWWRTWWFRYTFRIRHS
ncbi:MAG: hypothetical protein EOO60_10895 [Hymenobacter sp.]|nr:MAG: hypothetical protein EOO60_10895 [Hymenobacter sp.]